MRNETVGAVTHTHTHTQVGNNKKEKNIKKINDNGVTLIALVMTIIILIILATISITTLFGENGIITRTIETRDAQEKATALEEIEMAITLLKMNHPEYKLVYDGEYGIKPEGQTETKGGAETGINKYLPECITYGGEAYDALNETFKFDYKKYEFIVNLKTGKVSITGDGSIGDAGGSIAEGVIPIYTSAQLQAIGSEASLEINGKTYIMNKDAEYMIMNDITIDENFDGIATFRGTLDGNSKKIFGLGFYKKMLSVDMMRDIGEFLGIDEEDITEEEMSFGLICINAGTIKNLEIDVSHTIIDLETILDEGDVIGFLGFFAAINLNTINNCSTSAISGGINFNGIGLVGGNLGTMQNCFNTSNINGSYIGLAMVNMGIMRACYNTGNATGGEDFVGIAMMNMGTLDGCFNSGNINMSGGTSAGIAVMNMGTLDGCFNSGNINTLGGASVGIAIMNMEQEGYDNLISYCYNTGNLTGDSVYGIVATSQSPIEHCYNTGNLTGALAYGIVYMALSSVENCYNTGELTGNNAAGYAIGIAKVAVSIENCYNEGTITGPEIVAGIAYESISIKYCHNTGELAGGVVSGIVHVAQSSIEHCYNTGKLTGSTVCGIAFLSESSIEHCYNDGELTGNYAQGITTIAPLIERCYNTGIITSYGSGSASGIALMSDESIKQCYNTGTITSYDSGAASGISGLGLFIEQCYNTGTITGVDMAIGIGFGTIKYCYNTGTIISNELSIGLGVVLGENTRFCYNIGKVNGELAIPVAVGQYTFMRAEDSYWYNVEGSTYSTDHLSWSTINQYVTQLNRTQLTDQNQYVGWFDLEEDIWGIKPGEPPHLKNLPTQTFNILPEAI